MRLSIGQTGRLWKRLEERLKTSQAGTCKFFNLFPVDIDSSLKAILKSAMNGIQVSV